MQFLYFRHGLCFWTWYIDESFWFRVYLQLSSCDFQKSLLNFYAYEKISSI